MKPKTANKNRRVLLTGSIGLGAIGSVLPAAWTKPMISSVILPAHAQTSCPAPVAGNVVFGPLSGAAAASGCAVTFDILSSDPATPLTIISVTNSALAAGVTVTYNGFGQATDTTGPRINWRGAAAAAPNCTNVNAAGQGPVADVTFTVLASCDGSPQFSTELSLQQIVSSGSFGNP